MNKIILTVALVVIGFTATSAQSGFGITAGYTNGTEKSSSDGSVNFSISESGFYGGVSFDVEAGESLDVRTQVLYTNVGELSLLQMPLRLKYNISDSGFNLQAGPQFNLILSETSEFIRSLSVGFGAGLGYDISEHVFVEANYAFQLTNSRNNSVQNVFGNTINSDQKLRYQFFNIGFGYKFD